MSSQKQRASPGGAPPACHRTVGSRASRRPSPSGPGSRVCAVPATGQAPASAAAAATLPAAPSTRLAPGLAASPVSLAAGLVHSVPPSGSARLPVALAAAVSAASSALASLMVGGGPSAAAAATSRAAGIAAALPQLVSGEGPPTQQEQRQLQSLWLWGGEAVRAHIAQTVANNPPLLLHFLGGVDRDEVMDLISEFSSCFVHLGICY